MVKKKVHYGCFCRKFCLNLSKKKERKNEKQKFIKNHALKLTGYAVFNFSNNYYINRKSTNQPDLIFGFKL